MIKDTRYIIRRVIIGVLISLILSFIYACEVKAEGAEGIEVESVTLNYSANNNAVTHTILNNNSGYFKNWGRTRLQFIVALWDFSSTTSINLPVLFDVQVEQGTQVYTCNIGNNNIIYSNTDDQIGNVYTINCDIPTNATGIQRIKVNVINVMQSYHINTSKFLTGYKNIDEHISNQLNDIQSIINNNNIKLDNIYSSIDEIEGKLANEINQIMASTNAIINAINNIATAITNGNQAIIANQDENTQEQIESQKVCNYIDKNKIIKEKAYLNSNGNIYETNTNYGITDYIKLDDNTEIKVVNTTSNASAQMTCFYNINKIKISCFAAETLFGTLTIPNNASYVRFSINSNSNVPTFNICKNGNQATNDSINDVNDTLNNSNVSIDTLPSDNINMGPISSLVTLPLTALNNIVSAFSGTCTPFNIGSLLGTNLVFPCINIESLIGSFLWNTIDIIVTGIFIFSIRQRFVDLFYKLVTLKDIGLKGGF